MERKINGRKKSHKRTGVTKRKTTRRRRIGAAGDIGGMLQKAGGLVVGAVAARELNALAAKMFPSLTPIMSGLLQIGVGFALPKFVKGAFISNMGDGMIANGGMVTVVSTGLISGVDTMTYRINGTSRMRVVNGTANMPVINGPTTRTSSVPTNNIPRVTAKNFSVRG